MDPDSSVGWGSKRYLVNRGVAEGGLTGASPTPTAFSDDSQTMMLEGASELDHQIHQASCTSMRKRA